MTNEITNTQQALEVFYTVFATGSVIALVGNLFIALGNIRGYSSVVVGTIVILIAGGIHLCLYMCPHCGNYLDRTSVKGFCPHCGSKIEESIPVSLSELMPTAVRENSI